MRRTILATLVTVFSASTFASTFQHQTDANFGWLDINGAELQQWNLAHQFYLAPVNLNGKAPFAEAGFLSRIASVNGTYSYTDIDLGATSQSSSNWSIGGEYKDISHNFYASAQLLELNGSKDRAILASAGLFISSDWLVKLDARNIRPDSVGSYTEYGISTKKLMALDNGNFINIEASFMDVRGDNDSEYSVAADYYFGRNIALGLAYDWTSDDVVNANSDSITVRGSWYLQPNIALRAAVSFDYLGSGEEQYQLGASYRF
ncbi:MULTISPECIES: putative porin [Rheinheimera]|uniref:putative porin n=1 Tax=Rheinheimera TaxID=67575 RepID=UPI0010490206|nr:putative porin [Rheinheimera sp. D18]QBL09160.1 putative porin [Rheinheimera sp. D18]